MIDPPKPKKFRSLHFFVTLLTVVLGGSDARAHGPAPAVLAALGDGEDVSHLRLTVGFAAREGDEWRWICPTSWGGPDTPVAVRTPTSLIVFAEAGMVALIDGNPIIVNGGEALSAATVRSAVTASDGTLFVLARVDGEDLLLAAQEGAPRTIARLQGDWHSLALVDGSPVLATIRNENLVLAAVRLDGTGLSETEVPLLDAAGSTAIARSNGNRLWVLLSTADDYRLFEIIDRAAELEFASNAPIHGPIPVGESLFAVSGGALWRLAAPALDLWDASIHYTCASGSGPSAFVCAQTDLFELFEDGVATIPSFEHSDLLPPLEAAGPCLGEWLDYAGHAGLSLDPPEVDPEAEMSTDPPRDRGCSAGSGRHVPSRAPLFLFATLFALRRR